MGIMTMVPGGFFTFACVMATVHYFTRDKSKIRKDFGCAACTMQDVCTDEKKQAETAERAHQIMQASFKAHEEGGKNA